ALDAGNAVLQRGGSAREAVIASVTVLEDSPLFNAGKGAVLTHEGVCELDASIMDGRERRAGAVAGVRYTRNPIELARAVMDKSPHVMMVGEGAERFADSLGFERVPNDYFQTERRRLQLERARQRDEAAARQAQRGDPSQSSADEFSIPDLALDAERKWGTVGAVALDRSGNLAAGTSTGGMTNKRFGRVGDSPIIGAGNYADNRTCAVSATGHGEYFIRANVAHTIAARMAFAGEAVHTAAQAAIADVAALGGTGGVIALARDGAVAMPFNTPGMYRGLRFSDGRSSVEIFGPSR
ncbi:MAG: isoaspartyl peptidase/L-asparaginase family protein, partial [Opitutaceae bacterium]